MRCFEAGPHVSMTSTINGPEPKPVDTYDENDKILLACQMISLKLLESTPLLKAYGKLWLKRLREMLKLEIAEGQH